MIYELSCTTAGIDRVQSAELVNLSDLFREHPAAEADAFVRITPIKTLVVRIPEDAA